MKRILTGITPSSSQLHLGNYFGALQPMLELQKSYGDGAEFFLFLSNMHALTKDNYDPQEVKDNSLSILKIYLAAGIDPNKFFIYKQSDIPAHAQLTWLFMCGTHMGHMERMHAYKDAAAKGKSGSVSVGTFAYPLLMTVDIILYDAHIVPVGKDQKQHVEFARDAAQKFNHRFGETFVLPEPYIQENVATIPGTDGRKMSKSYNNYIGLLDDPKTIKKKVMRIPTDTLPVEAKKDPDSCHVYNIMKLFLNESENAEMRRRYEQGGLSYKDAKMELHDRVVAFVAPIQEKFLSLDDDMIRDMLYENAKKANMIAEKKIEEVYQKVGFTL